MRDPLPGRPRFSLKASHHRVSLKVSHRRNGSPPVASTERDKYIAPPKRRR
jgi:hypothetical protein